MPKLLSRPLRRVLNGLGTVLLVIVSVWNCYTLTNDWFLRHVLQCFSSVLLFASVTLAVAVHSCYPSKHDKPSDFKELLTQGPYALCRHLFYLFMMLIQFSICLYFLSVHGLILYFMMLPLWLALIKIEERELISYWGDKYRQYMKSVPMLMPRVKRKCRCA